VILAVITHDRGTVEETAWQALTMARRLADDLGAPLHAMWVGDGLDPSLVGTYGVDTVHLASGDGFDDYNPRAWGRAVAGLVGAHEPAAVVAIGSDRGNEVMANVGAITGLPMAANVREVEPGAATWKLLRTRWGGSLLEDAELDAVTKLLTVAEHAVAAEEAAQPTTPQVMAVEVDLDEGDLVTKVIDRVVTSDGITLATAPVVVSGGRGVGSPEGFAPLEELAALLGGVVGCSRVVTNNGWRPHSDQVGQTGTVVAPDLYIACGISGAIQHWVGMMASKTIIAVNTDSEASMVTKADYAVLGDLSEIVPAIVDEVKRRRSA
jgi:electron transfer flavoprotein alpha subunit